MVRKTKAATPPPDYNKDLAESVQTAIRHVARQAVTLELPIEQVNWLPLISKNIESSGWRLLHPSVRKQIILTVMTKAGVIDQSGALNIEALEALGNSN
jgi:hypothetical protein